jgi:hypothetical protein
LAYACPLLGRRFRNPIQDIWAYQPYTEGTVYGTSEGIDADVQWLGPTAPERIGFPTQKPLGLLERIIRSSCPEGGTVLDAYCGCGTTIAVAHRLNRRWIGMDITYQAISTVLTRLEIDFPGIDLRTIVQDGMPKDRAAAMALAHKTDDRLRKEFEKWAILTYCNNKAVINEKKGADKGIDGVTYISVSPTQTLRMVLQVKSGAVSRKDIAALQGDMDSAEFAVMITLEEPSSQMKAKAKAAGIYENETTGIKADRIGIVTIGEIIEGQQRLKLPQSLEALKLAFKETESKQLKLNLQPPEPEQPQYAQTYQEQLPKKIPIKAINKKPPRRSQIA